MRNLCHVGRFSGSVGCQSVVLQTEHVWTTFWVRTGSRDKDDGIVLVQINAALVDGSSVVVSTFDILYHDGVGFGVMSHLF
jgi:hypothetical protein